MFPAREVTDGGVEREQTKAPTHKYFGLVVQARQALEQIVCREYGKHRPFDVSMKREDRPKDREVRKL